METNKEQYATPAIEVIEMEVRDTIMGTSPGADDNGDPDVKKSAPRRANFWGD